VVAHRVAHRVAHKVAHRVLPMGWPMGPGPGFVHTPMETKRGGKLYFYAFLAIAVIFQTETSIGQAFNKI